MTFIERELCHDKRRNLTVYEMLLVDCIGTKSRWNLLNGSSVMIREGIERFTKKRLMEYWLRFGMTFKEGSSSTIKEGTWTFMKALCWFNWHRVVMTFIDEKLFQDKRKNLTVYEMLIVDCIGTESWWHLLNASSFMIREGTRRYMKGSQSILLTWSCDDIYRRISLPL
jgi:hypothetical protein